MDAQRLVGAVALVVVEVDVGLGRDDDPVAGVDGLLDVGLVAPHRDDGLGGGAAVEDLVPADDASPQGGHVLGEGAREPGLDAADLGDALAFHELGGDRRGLPLGGGDLVAADVDERGVEDLGDGVEDVAGELEGGLGGLEDLLEHAEGGGDALAVPGAELGVGGQDGAGVAGEVDLGDDHDVPFAPVGDDLPQVGERVVAAVRGAVGAGLVAGVADDGLGPPGGDLGEPGPGGDLDAPALVVGQVEVDDVEPVDPGPLDHGEHELLGLEVPGDVDVDASPAQARGVVDRDARDHRLGGGGGAEGVGGQELAERGDAAGDPGGMGGGEVDAAVVDAEPVGLGLARQVRGPGAFEAQPHGRAVEGGPDVQAQAGAAGEEVGQEPGEAGGLGVGGDDGAQGGEVELASGVGEVLRLRDQRYAALHAGAPGSARRTAGGAAVRVGRQADINSSVYL